MELSTFEQLGPVTINKMPVKFNELDYFCGVWILWGIMVLLYIDYLWNKGVYSVLETYFASAGETENYYFTRR